MKCHEDEKWCILCSGFKSTIYVPSYGAWVSLVNFPAQRHSTSNNSLSMVYLVYLWNQSAESCGMWGVWNVVNCHDYLLPTWIHISVPQLVRLFTIFWREFHLSSNSVPPSSCTTRQQKITNRAKPQNSQTDPSSSQ